MKSKKEFLQEVKHANTLNHVLDCNKIKVDVSKNYQQLNKEVFNQIEALEEHILQLNLPTNKVMLNICESLTSIDLLLHQMELLHHELKYEANPNSKSVKESLITLREDFLGRAKTYCKY